MDSYYMIYSKKTFIIIFFYVFSFSTGGYAQEKLSFYKDFFNGQKIIYDNWLNMQNFNYMFKSSSLKITDKKLELHIQSNFNTDDSLRLAWEGFRDASFQQSGDRLESFLLSQFAFLMQCNIDSTSIYIKDKNSTKTLISINFDEDIILETFFSLTMEGGSLSIPINEIFNKGKEQQVFVETLHVKKISKSIKEFLYSYYAPKSTFFYNAHIDTLESYYNSFTIRVSCINKEIISDGYFEYINIRVEIEKIENTIIVRYDIYGAYASGIRCPRFREGFYVPIGENNYPGKMAIYAMKMKNKINDFLRHKMKKHE